MAVDVPDQRRNRRFELRLPFELVRAGSRQVNEVGETENLSSGGVLFISKEELKIGDRIEYLITFPAGSGNNGGVKLHCVGKVIRQREQEGDSAAEKPKAIAATLERYQFVRSGR